MPHPLSSGTQTGEELAVRPRRARGRSAEARRLHRVIAGLRLGRLEAAQAKCERLARRLEEVNRGIVRLVRVFEDTESVPAEVKRRCRELEDERLRLEVDLELATRKLHDVREPADDPEAIADFLRSFLDTLEALPLPKKKLLIQENVGSVVVNYSLPEPNSEGSGDEISGRIIRKPEILVNTEFKAKTPEQGCSGASGGTCVNRRSDFPEFDVTGSPPTLSRRMVFGLLLRLRFAEIGAMAVARAKPSPPARPLESPAERAMRFHRMVDQASSRAALARQLGCSRAWVTKALRDLPPA